MKSQYKVIIQLSQDFIYTWDLYMKKSNVVFVHNGLHC